MSLIELKDLNKEYSNGEISTYALKNVNLKIYDGDMIAIMGPSGAGKSTLLNILGCLDKHSSGMYVLRGKKIDDFSKKELSKVRNREIGFIFQNFALIPEYTVRENLELPLLYKNNSCNKRDKLNKKQRMNIIEKALKNVLIPNLIDKKPSHLSGGQQQRVAIARALINNPNIILADEPTGALDQKTGQEIMNLLKKINKCGKTIIIVTHDSSIASYCDKRIEVIDGVVKQE